MTRLRKTPLRQSRSNKNNNILESLRHEDLKKHLSHNDLPDIEEGTCHPLPAVTVVFDLSGSSLSIRERGAENWALESQQLFTILTDIIYENNGIVEKFPGDGISMHFPVNYAQEELISKEKAIDNAFCAIISMYKALNKLGLKGHEYRFSLAYGEDTIVTVFGSPRHRELISIGHAVNVAHKLEKLVKQEGCFIGMDYQCMKVAQHRTHLCFWEYLLPYEMWTNVGGPQEFWFGVKL